MSNQSTLFNPGKILETLENGLTFLSLKIERTEEKKLGRYYKKDLKANAINKREALRQKQNKLQVKPKDISFKKNSQVLERIHELDSVEQDPFRDVELD